MIAGRDTFILLIVAVGAGRTLAGRPAATSPGAAAAVLVPPPSLLPRAGLGGVVLVALLLVMVPVTLKKNKTCLSLSESTPW